MAVQLEGDDFYKLPKHVQEQLRAQGLGPEPEGVDEEQAEAIRTRYNEDAQARTRAVEARWEAAMADLPEPEQTPPEPPQKATGRRPSKTADIVAILLAWVLFTGAAVVALVAPVEIALVPLFGAVIVILIRWLT